MRMTSPTMTPFWRDPDADISLRTPSARCVAIAHAQRHAPAAGGACVLAPPARQDAAIRSDAAAGDDRDVFEVALS